MISLLGNPLAGSGIIVSESESEVKWRIVVDIAPEPKIIFFEMGCRQSIPLEADAAGIGGE
jgi:hypothetical protein